MTAPTGSRLVRSTRSATSSCRRSPEPSRSCSTAADLRSRPGCALLRRRSTFDFTIKAGTLLADQTGSVVVDIWADTYANFPPTVADKITGSAPLTISAARQSQDTTLTGWSPSVVAGKILFFNVNSCSVITQCAIGLKYTR